jgi:opacity protein-like surface antigen
MSTRLLIAIALCVVSVSCEAQVVPAAGTTHAPLSGSINVGMDYWSGDWGRGNINRWGPTVSGTATVWHDFSVIAEGRSMIWGGNQFAQNFKYVEGSGGIVWISDYFGRFQPLIKAEAGIGSLTHPPNGSGRAHETSNTWTLGGGFEYHTHGRLWTRVEYDYDYFTNFYSSLSGQFHTLNPRGITFGETYRFGRAGARY